MLESLTKLNTAIVTLTATIMEYNNFILSQLKNATGGAEVPKIPVNEIPVNEIPGEVAEEKPAPKKKRASRKKKVTKKEVVEEPEVDDMEGMETLANDADPSMAAMGQAPLEYSDVRAKAQEALDQMGSVEVLGSLLHDEFKVDKLSAMAATDYPRFINRLNEIIALDAMPEEDDLDGIL